jgi:flagellar basal-body rod protein FlgG
MLDALYISAIGLRAQQEQLDATANNFANLSTTAFKRQSVDFAAILDRGPALSGADPASTTDARPNSLQRFDMAQGEVHATGRALDVAIVGSGFLEVELADNKTGYSRAGSLQISADGGLSLASGQALKADVRIPAGAKAVQIQADGGVTAQLPGESTPRVVGQIELATFTNAGVLQYRGDGIFIAPEGTADPTRSRPGEGGTEPLATQSLEASNVNMTDEMVSMTLMQRVYELNSRVAQVADELMGMANNLRRG